MGKLKCGECNSTNVALKNFKGLAFAYKSYPSVVLSENCELNACENCGNIIYFSEDYDLLNNAIEASVKSSTKTLIEELMLLTGMNQKELAKDLGISEVHVSNAKNCKAVLEYRTYNLLETKVKLAIVTRNSKQYINSYLYARAIPKTVKSFYETRALDGTIYAPLRKEDEVVEAAESNDFSYAMAA